MIEIGAVGEASLVVTDRDTASAISISEQDRFPEVFATSRMIALMEVAGARAMAKLLSSGQLSVGVVVNVRHFAATPKNTKVSATATYLGMEGKFYKFRVEAFDPAGKVGEGEHLRAIIDTERLLQGAALRLDREDS
ncbi:MAG: thioesterase family protein [Terriglobales bacterium]